MDNQQALLMYAYLDLLSEARKARSWHMDGGMKVATPPVLLPGACDHILRNARHKTGMG